MDAEHGADVPVAPGVLRRGPVRGRVRAAGVPGRRGVRDAELRHRPADPVLDLLRGPGVHPGEQWRAVHDGRSGGPGKPVQGCHPECSVW